MNYLKKERFGYFLIWGHGLPYKDEIFQEIRQRDFIDILRIIKHQPRNIKKFVKIVYSHDYAPLQHLKSKTEYLLNTHPEVLFIFFRNSDARERYFGKGFFRHIECIRIKKLKEEIRDKYNPRKNGKRTEDHVVHASDSESQVNHILRYLKLKKGADFFKKNPNPSLSLPYYLPKFNQFKIRRIVASQLLCNILRGNKNSYWSKSVPIEKTPHFICLKGNPKPYEKYLRKFIGGPLTCDYSIEKLMTLSRNLRYLKSPYTNSYIAVEKTQFNKYLIVDGVHRASVLKFKKINNFPVAVINEKSDQT